jgi:hypothetical protein
MMAMNAERGVSDGYAFLLYLDSCVVLYLVSSMV